MGAHGLVVLLYSLHGQTAKRFREECCNVMVRYFGGDEALIPEIAANAIDPNKVMFQEAVQSMSTSAITSSSPPSSFS